MFFKKRYLIACYSTKDDYLMFVADNENEFISNYFNLTGRKLKRFNPIRSAKKTQKHKYKVYLIDVLNETKDVFLEEDRTFKEFIYKNNLNCTKTEYIKKLTSVVKQSVRSIWRKGGEIDKQKIKYC